MKLTFFILFFILTSFNVFSLGKKERMDNTQNTTVENTATIDSGNLSVTETDTTMITGKIQIYGNEPHTFVGIIDGNGKEYAVYPPSWEEELKKLQGHLIEFTVVLLDEPQGYGGVFLKGGTVRPIAWKLIQ